jgi:hypothetical protein
VGQPLRSLRHGALPGRFSLSRSMAHTFSKRVAEAGIVTIDSDAGILGPTQATHAINGTDRSYNRDTRVWKLMDAVISRVVWEDFVVWLKCHHSNVDLSKVYAAASMVAEALRDHKGSATTEFAVLVTAVGMLNLFELLELYKTTLAPTQLFWSDTLSFINIILDVLRGVG